MKQLKFLMVAFTLLMGVSLTSCLNSDPGENAYDGYGYVRVKMGMYFEDTNGNTYYPTSSSVAEMEKNQGFKMSGTDLAYIVFKNVEEAPATKATGKPQSFRIKLVSAAAVDSYQTERASSVEDMESMVTENAPIVTLEPMANNGQIYKPWMYGTQMLVLPISWKMENKQETLAQHKFNLVYVENDEAQSDTELVFYLRHDKGTDTKTEVFAVREKAFDVTYIMEEFKLKNGSYPEKITIKAKTDEEGKELPEKYTDYSITPKWDNESK